MPYFSKVRVPSFPSCTWERKCPRNFAASACEAQLRGQVRSQVQLGNEEAVLTQD
jgi:hypothetical protein